MRLGAAAGPIARGHGYGVNTCFVIGKTVLSALLEKKAGGRSAACCWCEVAVETRIAWLWRNRREGVGMARREIT